MINATDLLAISLAPVKRAIKCWILELQIRACDRDIELTTREIANAHRVLSERTKDRMNLVRRRMGACHERR